IGERLAILYGSNTAGAIAGTLTAGLYLIPVRGIHGAFLWAASLNLLVGLSAILVGRAFPLDAPETSSEEPRSSAGERPPSVTVIIDSKAGEPPTGGGALRVVLIVFALSGFTSLALEVVWFRVLTLFLRPTVYGFALMLAAVLAGIAIGSYLVTPFLDRNGR